MKDKEQYHDQPECNFGALKTKNIRIVMKRCHFHDIFNVVILTLFTDQNDIKESHIITDETHVQLKVTN